MRISICTYKGLVPLHLVTIRDGVEPGEGGEGGHTVSSVQSCLVNTCSINSTLELMQLNFCDCGIIQRRKVGRAVYVIRPLRKSNIYDD